jgi:hypothetical protein
MQIRTREELEAMTVRQLRLIDIRSTEEEALVQAILNKKMALRKPDVKVNRSDAPDIKTPEQEAEYQKVIDAREARVKERLSTSGAPKSTSEVSSQVDDVSNVKQPENDSDENLVDHTLTQEDLDENPDLVTEGLKVGDVIQIPAEDKTEDEGKPTTKPIERMSKGELIEHARTVHVDPTGLNRKELLAKIEATKN